MPVPAKTAKQKRREVRSRLFLVSALGTFFFLLLIAGWLFFLQNQESVDPRSQAAVDRSYQVVVEPVGSTPAQQFNVYVMAPSEDAQAMAFATEIIFLPAEILRVPPSNNGPVVPEARDEVIRQTLKSLWNWLTRVPVAHAQVTVLPRVSSPLAKELSFSATVNADEALPDAWRVTLAGRARNQVMLSGRVLVAEVTIPTDRPYTARIVSQSVRGSLRSLPGVETELTRVNPRGFACPAVIEESCPAGFALGTDSLSSCVACLRTSRFRWPWQSAQSDTAARELQFACTQIYQPVCGEDEKTYSNECEAIQAEVTILHSGVCGL